MPPAKKTAAKRAPAKKTAAKKATSKRAAPGGSVEVVSAPASMTMVRVGGHDYPLVSSPKCHTCQSPHRRWIENELLLGRSYASIADRLADMETGRSPHPSVDSMRSHVESGHTPVPARVRRQIMDRRAQELGSKIIGDDSVVDHVTLNSLMIQQAHEDLVSGKISLTAADISAIIATRVRIEETSKDGYESEVMEAALFAQMEATMALLPAEQIQEYASLVESNPVLKAALAKVREREREADLAQG